MTDKKFISRDRRTLPTEPRHRCKKLYHRCTQFPLTFAYLISESLFQRIVTSLIIVHYLLMSFLLTTIYDSSME